MVALKDKAGKQFIDGTCGKTACQDRLSALIKEATTSVEPGDEEDNAVVLGLDEVKRLWTLDDKDNPSFSADVEEAINDLKRAVQGAEAVKVAAVRKDGALRKKKLLAALAKVAKKATDTMNSADVKNLELERENVNTAIKGAENATGLKVRPAAHALDSITRPSQCITLYLHLRLIFRLVFAASAAPFV